MNLLVRAAVVSQNSFRVSKLRNFISLKTSAANNSVATNAIAFGSFRDVIGEVRAEISDGVEGGRHVICAPKS